MWFILCSLLIESIEYRDKLRAGRPVFKFRQWQWWDFFSPSRSDWLRGPPDLLSNG